MAQNSPSEATRSPPFRPPEGRMSSCAGAFPSISRRLQDGAPLVLWMTGEHGHVAREIVHPDRPLRYVQPKPGRERFHAPVGLPRKCLVVTPSSWSAWCLERSGIPKERIRIVPHGFDSTVFHRVERPVKAPGAPNSTSCTSPASSTGKAPTSCSAPSPKSPGSSHRLGSRSSTSGPHDPVGPKIGRTLRREVAKSLASKDHPDLRRADAGPDGRALPGRRLSGPAFPGRGLLPAGARGPGLWARPRSSPGAVLAATTPTPPCRFRSARTYGSRPTPNPGRGWSRTSRRWCAPCCGLWHPTVRKSRTVRFCPPFKALRPSSRRSWPRRLSCDPDKAVPSRVQPRAHVAARPGADRPQADRSSRPRS